jgi:purine nucleosidase
MSVFKNCDGWISVTMLGVGFIALIASGTPGSALSAKTMASDPALKTSPVVELIVDADTANEMDDLYAVTQVLVDPRARVTAVNSAHFNNVELYVRRKWHKYDMAGFIPVAASQKENVALLGAWRSKVPALLGADDILGYSWGYFEGAPIPRAPAVDNIIAAAKAMPEGKRLNVAVLGPMTNVAAAVATAPEIAGRISVYSLGTRYDPATRVWNKNDFNSRNDINALDFLLDNKDIELTIMPVSTAAKLPFFRAASLAEHSKLKHPANDILRDRWDFVSAVDMWTMWDLALTMAMTHPELSTIETVAPPPENSRTSVRVYTSIDGAAMEKKFWSLLADGTKR